MPQARGQAIDPITRSLAVISKRFNLRLRLAREIYRDGYLRINPVVPDYVVHKSGYSQNRTAIFMISQYYGTYSDKFINLFNSGYLDLNGLDYKNAISRYLQQHAGRLSVRLLCYLAYDDLRPGGGVVTDQNAQDCLSALKIEGKLRPPKDLEPYLASAIRGNSKSLERIARWMRDLIENVGTAHGWAFYGVRLALAEGCYDVSERPIPKLRTLKNHRKLAKRLREHPLLQGCATPVARSGRNREFSYIYHRPGKFWDL